MNQEFGIDEYFLPNIRNSIFNIHIASIVTRTGDTGDTGLVGKRRVSKADPRLHAIGTVDELNALLGVVLAGGGLPDGIRTQIVTLQHRLFRLGADLAAPGGIDKVPRIEAGHIAEVERWIRAIEAVLPPLIAFIVPGGTEAGGRLHHARTVCRRAERWVVALSENEPSCREAIVFLNRLGDYLFLAAREANRAGGSGETRAAY